MIIHLIVAILIMGKQIPINGFMTNCFYGKVTHVFFNHVFTMAHQTQKSRERTKTKAKQKDPEKKSRKRKQTSREAKKQQKANKQKEKKSEKNGEAGKQRSSKKQKKQRSNKAEKQKKQKSKQAEKQRKRIEAEKLKRKQIPKRHAKAESNGRCNKKDETKSPNSPEKKIPSHYFQWQSSKATTSFAQTD